MFVAHRGLPSSVHYDGTTYAIRLWVRTSPTCIGDRDRGTGAARAGTVHLEHLVVRDLPPDARLASVLQGAQPWHADSGFGDPYG